MQLLYPAMIVVGVAMVAWGLPAAHRLRYPFDVLAAFLVLVGTAVALFGALLTAVPGFLQG